jgi:hypothetical protein
MLRKLLAKCLQHMVDSPSGAQGGETSFKPALQHHHFQ